MLFIVGLIWVIYLVLFLKSRNLKGEGEKKGILRILHQMSVYLLSCKMGRKLYASSVRRDLRVLRPLTETEQALRSYYEEKLEIVLLVLFLGVHFITIICYSNDNSGLLQEGNRLQRGKYDEESQPVTLQVFDEQDRSMDIDYVIENREYTKAEIVEMAKQLEENLQELVLGANADCMEITENLKLASTYDGYPFAVEWESEDYTLIDSDGTVYNDELSQRRTCGLTAVMEYMEYTCEYQFFVQVCPKMYTPKEQKTRAISQALKKADEETKAEAEFILPQKISGKPVYYKLKTETNQILYYLILGAIVFVVFYAKDQDLKKELEERQKELVLEYPEFISKFVLLAGAGMTMRNVFGKMSQDASQGDYLKQELQILVRDLNNGILEKEALDRFGNRSQNTLYIKFCALLIQNLKKGTRDFMPMLEEESREAFLIRKNNAKRLGEEAGTKLLVPMIMMLAVVMVLIMVPAFLSFQL